MAASEDVTAVRHRLESLVRELEGILSDLGDGVSRLAPGERRIQSRYKAVKQGIADAHRRASAGRHQTREAVSIFWARAVHAAHANLRAPSNCSDRRKLSESIAAAVAMLRVAVSGLDAAAREPVREAV